MRVKPADDPIVHHFKAALEGIYGNQIERVVLFGSRARGEEHEESDCDMAVFLKTLPDKWNELHRLADLRVEFLDETGVFFDAKPYPVAAWHDRTPLMHEIRLDGLEP